MIIKNQILLKRPWAFPVFTVIGGAIGVIGPASDLSLKARVIAACCLVVALNVLAGVHFGGLAAFVGFDIPASSAMTYFGKMA
jgi:hypothetical protein